MQILRLTSALTILLAVAATASAQAPGVQQGYGTPPDFTPIQRHYDPPISPYLGLLNANNSFAFNYYEIYRPQRRFQNAYENLNSEVGQLRSNVRTFQQTNGQNPEQFQLGPTGHPTMFMDTRGYFPAMGY